MPGSAVIGNLAVNLSLETAAFTAGATAAQSSMRVLTSEAQNMSGGLRSFGLSANNARVVGLEMAHVTRALGEQLAMGVSPARAFASEIGRISTAVQYAGGVGGLARAIGGLIAPFAAAAAGAGFLATAFLGIKQAADGSDLKGYIDTLGLTEQQIEKLKNTTVTWGDVTTATFQVMAEKAGTSSSAISGFFSTAFHSIGEFGKFSVAIILAAFGAMVKGAADIIQNLPAVVGGGIAAAANLGIAALEKLVNFGIAGLNKLGSTINSVLGTSIGQVAEVSLGRVQDNFSGTMKAIGADVSGTFHDIFNRTEATFNQISARAVQLRKNDLATQAAALRSSDAAGKAAKGHAERAKAVKEETNALDKLLKNLDALLGKEKKLDAELLNPKPLAEIKLPEIPQMADKIRSPWQEWADSIPQTAAEITAAFQGIATRGLDGISAAIGDVITGARSLKDAFGDVARSIISNLIEMAAKMLIFRALSGIFGGLSFDSAGFSNVVASNSADLGVAMPGMASGGRGTFGGFSGVDKNVLSLNGAPMLRVSKGEHFSVEPANQNAPSRVVLELRNDMLEAQIAQGAGVQIIRASPFLRTDAMRSIGERGRRR
jgi:hypothetical protein